MFKTLHFQSLKNQNQNSRIFRKQQISKLMEQNESSAQRKLVPVHAYIIKNKI